MLSKMSCIIQIPPGKHVRKSCDIQIPPGKHSLMQIIYNGDLSAPEYLDREIGI